MQRRLYSLPSYIKRSLMWGGGPLNTVERWKEPAWLWVQLNFIVTRSPSVAFGASSLPEGAFLLPFFCLYKQNSHKPFDRSVGTFCCCDFSVKNNKEIVSVFLFKWWKGLPQAFNSRQPKGFSNIYFTSQLRVLYRRTAVSYLQYRYSTIERW